MDCGGCDQLGGEAGPDRVGVEYGTKAGHDNRRNRHEPVPALGFWIVDAPDLDAALKWAAEGSAACGGPVEVRPFQEEPEA